MRIALIGPPGVGKSSISDAFTKLYGGVRMSFAAGVKREVARAIVYSNTVGVTNYDTAIDEHLRRMADPATKDDYRRLLQVWGTDFRRGEDPEYWLKALIADLPTNPNTNVLVDDCRFPNEYDALVAAGFLIVRLLPGDTVRTQSVEASSHESEKHWQSFVPDYVLGYVPGPAAQAERLFNLLNDRTGQ